MKNFTLVLFFFFGYVAVVLSTDFAGPVSSQSSSGTTSSSGSTLGSRVARASRDDDDNDDDDDDNTKKSTTQNDGGSGGKKALRILRQHRIPSSSSSSKNDSNDEPTTTTRRSRHERAAAARVKNVHVTRQAQTFEPDSGAPGAPGVSDAPEDSQSTDTFAQPSGVQHSTGRQAPLAAPRPQAPPPAAAGPASLTLPDGADVILGDIKPGFTCESKIYGYYADIFNDCKLFHVCVPVGDENGVTNPIQWSFVCGNQTLFNQEKLTCDYQENVDCSKSENFYSINENFGRPEDKAAVAPGGPAPVPAPTRG